MLKMMKESNFRIPSSIHVTCWTIEHFVDTPHLPNASYYGHAECITMPFAWEEALSHIGAPFRSQDKHDHLATCLLKRGDPFHLSTSITLAESCHSELVICSTADEEITGKE